MPTDVPHPARTRMLVGLAFVVLCGALPHLPGLLRPPQSATDRSYQTDLRHRDLRGVQWAVLLDVDRRP